MTQGLALIFDLRPALAALSRGADATNEFACTWTAQLLAPQSSWSAPSNATLMGSGTLQGDRSFELRSRPEETRRTDSLAINRCFAMILDAAERSLEELPLSESADDGFFAPNGSS
eukprot:CAMPEP_0182851902 /NCGR_PEP_ID=MMETSP0006_2-20121128/30871_1 /TAXON_ID=97485 /ORGANISM="Prymnesium parvum, Strain Texoma1" /LENGTH=115 /DNA_ID=CAMNT_0024982597 /DNA_START=200 /DNA_END=544 /DNA_ORIENTATION=-